MIRLVPTLLLASFAVIAFGACNNDNDSGGDNGSYSQGDSCNAYVTCGSCTPVSGCGWCFNSTGGLCASTPDECTDVNEFTWTWDSSGCPDVDASVVPVGNASH